MQAKENREGITYSSNVGFTNPSIGEEIQVIPPPTHISSPTLSVANEHRIVFDLETGGFGTDSDITQISAISAETDDSFNQYVTPTKHISPGASATTGLENHGGVLMKNGQPVPTLPIKESLSCFLAWLNDRGRDVCGRDRSPSRDRGFGGCGSGLRT